MNKNSNLVELSKIYPDPKNPRQEFPPEEMKKLEDSIKRFGIKTPLVVEEMPDGRYLLVDGERRFRASKTLKLKEVPVNIQEPMSDTDRMLVRFQLQERHSQWTIYEKALAISELQNSLKLSAKELAETLGFSRSQVNHYLSILNLSKRTTNSLSAMKLPFDMITEVSYLSNHSPKAELRLDLEQAIVDKVENRIIAKTREIREYRIAIQSPNGEAIAKKIIKDPKYTSAMAAEDAGTSGKSYLKKTVSAASEVVSNGVNVISAKTVVTTIQHAKFVNAKKVIEKLVALDYEDEEEE